MIDNYKTLQIIKNNLRTAMQFKRELPEMTDKEQADMIQHYLSQDASIQKTDIMNANRGLENLNNPAKLAYAISCQTITIASIWHFVSVLRLIYKIPLLKYFCDYKGQFMKEAGLVIADFDNLTDRNKAIDEKAIDNVAEYLIDIPDKMKHLRIRLIAAFIIAVDLAVIIACAIKMHYFP